MFAASSFRPRPIVLAAIPVMCETVAMPPYPALLASVATTAVVAAHPDAVTTTRNAH
jgi:hypothetical protein